MNLHSGLDRAAVLIHESEPTQMSDCLGPGLLRVFLDSKKPLTQAGAAKQLDIVPAALTAYLKGNQRPRSDIRQRIAKWSQGAVPEASWLTAEERIGLDDIKVAVIPAPSDKPTDSDHHEHSADPTGSDP